MRAFYCDHFVLPLPETHRFPMSKYLRLRESLVEHGVLERDDLRVPEPVTDEQILRAHAREYVEQVKAGTLPAKAQRRIGFPWSEELVERSRRSAGGTLAAARVALAEGAAVNLAGGTHHSFADRGEGFCVFNDVAIACRALQAEGLVERALVVDTDVHQGNGTAAIFRHDPSVFTFSIHGRRNFPFKKEESDLDVELDDNTQDAAYLEALEQGLDRAFDRTEADLVFFVSGADPYLGDKLGRLAVSQAGLEQRDRRVFEFCRRHSLPVAVVMAGGYAPEVDDIVAIHRTTIALAKENRHPPVESLPRS